MTKDLLLNLLLFWISLNVTFAEPCQESQPKIDAIIGKGDIVSHSVYLFHSKQFYLFNVKSRKLSEPYKVHDYWPEVVVPITGGAFLRYQDQPVVVFVKDDKCWVYSLKGTQNMTVEDILEYESEYSISMSSVSIEFMSPNIETYGPSRGFFFENIPAQNIYRMYTCNQNPGTKHNALYVCNMNISDTIKPLKCVMIPNFDDGKEDRSCGPMEPIDFDYSDGVSSFVVAGSRHLRWLDNTGFQDIRTYDIYSEVFKCKGAFWTITVVVVIVCTSVLVIGIAAMVILIAKKRIKKSSQFTEQDISSTLTTQIK